MTEATFPVKLTERMAWLIRNKVVPGPYFRHESTAIADTTRRAHDMISGLRRKINAAILRFVDEPDLEQADVSLTEDEGWMLDQIVSPDGQAGEATDLLIQVFRGLWALDYGLSPYVCEDPHEMNRVIRLRPPNAIITPESVWTPPDQLSP